RERPKAPLRSVTQMNPTWPPNNKHHAGLFPGAACCHDLRRVRRWDEWREVIGHVPKRLASKPSP
ncbi:MAG TPA: hypothetical protein VF020_03150, partial [Chthoniobacterales bacterium]